MPLLTKKFFWVFVLLLIASGGVRLYVHYSRPKSIIIVPRAETDSTTTQEAEGTKHSPCLADNEYASYPKSINPLLTTPTTVPTPVSVYSSSGGSMTTFTIPNIPPRHYHPIELHRCGVYVIIESPNFFSFELWSYDYSGLKKRILTLANNDSSGTATVYYNYDFRIDSSEKYISLVRGFLGRDNYAIIIKDLKTIADVFTLSIGEMEKRNQDLIGDVSFESGGWTNDSRYFWADTHDGANTLGFIRIDMQTKTFELFPAPKDVLGGDALNIERGLITVHPGNVWYGIAQVTDAEKARRRAQSIGTELYIENLFTHERQFIASTTEPLYYFVPRWISADVLQYKLPSGATTTYTIPQ